MRRIVTTIVLLLAVGTGLPGAAVEGADKVRVVTTIPDLKSLTEAVGGDLVDVESLMRGTQNLHEAEVRPSMMLKLRRAQLLAKVKEEDRLGDSRALMEVLFRPLFEHVDENGERAYARFNLALISSPSGLQHSLTIFHLMPISDHVLDLLRLDRQAGGGRIGRPRPREQKPQIVVDFGDGSDG